VTAALFLIADMIGQQRGKASDYFVMAREIKQRALLGVLFLIVAMTIAGLPPFSGFLSKLIILQAAAAADERIWVWSLILLSSLVTIVALSRAGTSLFWRCTPSHDNNDLPVASRWQLCGALLLLGASPALTLFGASVIDFTNSAAVQLHDIQMLLDIMQLEGDAP
jgi:multicomponent K+:H+ antiporter subunit D